MVEAAAPGSPSGAADVDRQSRPRGLAVRLVRTTAFKLTIIYLSVFVVLSIGLIGYISLTTARILDGQIEDAIDGEIAELSAEFERSGLFKIMRTVEQRSLRPDASVYLITDRRGDAVSGNVAALIANRDEGDSGDPFSVRYIRLIPEADGEGGPRRALAKIIELGGYRLLVGRDVEDRIAFSAIIRRSIRGAIVVVVALAVLSWVFLSRSVLRKVDAMAASSRQIVAGDLARRLPTDGSGDEFDRLAASVNVMLEQIERLHAGLQDVSQNVAHDLKTPLTRLRNRLDDMIRGSGDRDAQKRELEAAIGECDGLIKTFDALLTIARVESQSAGLSLTPVDLSALMIDMAEFYEPATDDVGMALVADIEPGIVIAGEATLLRNMLANLIDNALKYAAEPGARLELSLSAAGDSAVLSVRDHGPGVPEANRPRLTDRFVRLDASRSKPGAGLGLSLVKAIVIHHGGTLSLEEAAPGLRVTVALPLMAGGASTV